MQNFEFPQITIKSFLFENVVTASSDPVPGPDETEIMSGNQSVDKSSPYAE